MSLRKRLVLRYLIPHGDLINSLIDVIPEHRIKDIVLIDPTDTEYPVALNVFGGKDTSLVVSTIVSTFQKLYSNSWGARTEYILTNAVTLLAQEPYASLLDIQKVLLDGNFRKQCLKKHR